MVFSGRMRATRALYATSGRRTIVEVPGARRGNTLEPLYMITYELHLGKDGWDSGLVSGGAGWCFELVGAAPFL